MKKVSASYADLLERGLVDREQAYCAAVVTALLPTLLESGRTVSIDGLQAAAGLPTTEVTGYLERLSSLGFAVESAEDKGFRIAEPFDDMLIPEAFVPLFMQARGSTAAGGVGLPYVYRAACESTNLLLKTEADRLPSGALLVTDDQTQGRGRLGRSWRSGPGEDLTFSVLLRPPMSPAEAPLLSLAAALAVAEMLESLPSLQGRVGIKWPNDVLLDNKKVCGILLESCLAGDELKWVVAGIGLNVNSDPEAWVAALDSAQREEWRGRLQPTSLKVETGKSVPRSRLLVELLARLQIRWSETTREDLLDSLRARDALLGHRIEVYAGPPDGGLLARGEAVGIGLLGELLVKTKGGVTVPVVAGEVTVHVDSPAA